MEHSFVDLGDYSMDIPVCDVSFGFSLWVMEKASSFQLLMVHRTHINFPFTSVKAIALSIFLGCPLSASFLRVLQMLLFLPLSVSFLFVLQTLLFFLPGRIEVLYHVSS